MTEEGVTLYAVWEINKYTITFNTNGGSVVNTITLDFNSKIENLEIPIKLGHTFSYWYLDSESVEFELANMPASNITLNAKWIINQYTITFETNGGTEISPITMYYGENVEEPDYPSKENYLFDGWYLDMQYKKPYIFTTMPAENITIYVKYSNGECTATYLSNDGNNLSYIQKMTYNETSNLLSNAFTREGYTFLYWQADNVTYLEGDSYSCIGDVTFIAIWKANQYNITFVKNNGEENDVINQEFNNYISYPNISYEHYNFLGWYLDSNCYEKFDETIMTVASNIILYAKWEADTYTITFNSSGGSEVDNIQATYGEIVKEPNNPTKDGYTFIGWYNGEELYSFGLLEQDVTLDAKWEANTYKIEFIENGGTTVPDIVLPYLSDIEKPSNPTRYGYDFIGWYDNNGIEFTFNKMPLNGITLYAKWELKTIDVVFDSNGGVGDNITQEYCFNQTKNLLKNTYERYGYEFIGWGTSPSGDVLYQDEELFTLNVEELTLYAKWKAVEVTITFHYEDEIETQQAYFGEKIYFMETSFYKKGHTIVSWETTDGTSYYNSKLFQINEITYDLYAVWEANKYEVIFVANNGSSATRAQSITYGNEATLYSNTFKKTGYHFVGWSLSSNGEIAYINRDTIVMDQEGITLYAIYEVSTFSLSYNANGGTGTMVSQSVVFNEQTTVSQSEFTRVGYNFIGFSTTRNGNVMYLPEDTITMTEEGITLYAVWEAKTYQITFDANGGIGTSYTQNVLFNSRIQLSANTFTKDKYVFVGWSTNKDSLTAEYLDQSYYRLTTEGITLYAIWEGAPYFVTYTFHTSDPNITGDIYTQTIKYLETKSVLDNQFEKYGYNFVGWSLTAEGVVAYSPNDPITMDQEGITLYAIFEIGSFDVLYDLNDGSSIITGPNVTYLERFMIDLDNPNRKGYEFKGWSMQPSGTVLYQKDATLSMDQEGITLYAIWDANSYMITFDSNNGSGEVKTQLVVYDLKTNLKSLNELGFSLYGYHFVGWGIDTSRASYRDEYPYTLKEEGVTLYAIWEADKLSITYHHDNISYVQTVSYKETVALNKNTFKKTGYLFAGWSLEENGEIEFEDEKEITIANYENIDLYAVFVISDFYITYYPNTGNGTSYQQSITFGETDYLISNTFTKEGYSFVGWSTSVTGNVLYEDKQAFTMLSEGINLYAIWQINFYHISYIQDGDVIAESNITYGDTIVLIADPVKEHYKFSGWYYDLDYELPYQSIKMPSNDIVLYAKWELNTFSITFVVNGGLEMEDVVYDYSEEIFYPEATKEGYTFIGWYVDYTLKNKATLKYMPDYDMTLYAAYTVNSHTITFNSLGGSPISQLTLDYNEIIPKLSSPNKNHYVFVGWYLDSNYENEFNLEVMPDYDITLYALYDPITVTIFFEENGGAETDDITGYYGYEIPTLPTLTKEGYTFLGWCTDMELLNLFTETKFQTSDITLYAKFVLNTYQITYNTNGGNQLTNSIISYGNQITLKTPTKAGSKFNGWYMDKNLEVEFNLSVMPNYNILVYAGWIDYVITQENVEYQATIVFNDDGTISLINSPSKAGYVFEGWYLDSDYTVMLDEDMIVDGNLTLYAKWTAKPAITSDTYYKIIVPILSGAGTFTLAGFIFYEIRKRKHK